MCGNPWQGLKARLWKVDGFKQAEQLAVSDNLRRQIEYYFSPKNLASDTFLKSKMDEDGWVAMDLIASFHRVQAIMAGVQNDNDGVLVHAIQGSPLLQYCPKRLCVRAKS